MLVVISRDIKRPRSQHRMLGGGSGMLCRERIVMEQRHMHMLLQDLRMLALRWSKCPRYTQRVFENHALGITLANALGFEAIGAYWLFLPTLDTSFATCCFQSARFRGNEN